MKIKENTGIFLHLSSLIRTLTCRSKVLPLDKSQIYLHLSSLIRTFAGENYSICLNTIEQVSDTYLPCRHDLVWFLWHRD